VESALSPVQATAGRLDGASSLCELFQATVRERSEELALRTAGGREELTWREYGRRIETIAGGLAGLGVEHGEPVALMLLNRHEFALVDCAAMHLGATPFSIYNTFPDEVISHLLANARCRVVVCEGEFAPRVLRAAEGTRVEHVVCATGATDGALTLEALEASAPRGFELEARWRSVGPDDLLTLIYTSGTTGPPKGVELTHANMLAELRAMAEALPVTSGGSTISYLPSAHIADRWSTLYTSMAHGLSVTYLPDPALLASTLIEVRPTVWGGVPRVLEKLRAGLEAALASETDAERRASVETAIDAGREVVRSEQAGKAVDAELAARRAQAERLFLAPLRHKVGLDRVERLAIGAAPSPPDLLEFYWAVGLPLLEVWGMSETSAVCTTNRLGANRIGTVGQPIAGAEVALADDGELLVRGALVMRGYRGEPEKTAEAIDEDGWLHTGDIATIDADGFVSIVDRKKELIINSAGKNMSPANIESHLKSSDPLIGQAVCIGDERPYNVALLVLEPEAVAVWAREHGLEGVPLAELATDEQLLAEIAAAVERANGHLARVEQIKRFHVLGEEWLPGSEELTPTMKLRRKPIARAYAGQIEELYSR
jgi:long-subunit acyl-CoA synthetase (AMP-forming)